MPSPEQLSQISVPLVRKELFTGIPGHLTDQGSALQTILQTVNTGTINGEGAALGITGLDLEELRTQWGSVQRDMEVELSGEYPVEESPLYGGLSRTNKPQLESPRGQAAVHVYGPNEEHSVKYFSPKEKPTVKILEFTGSDIPFKRPAEAPISEAQEPVGETVVFEGGFSEAAGS